MPGIQGLNTVGKNPYRGPCPAAGSERYVFKVYALDKVLDLSAGSRRSNVDLAMAGHVLAAGVITGVYDRTVAAEKNRVTAD